MRMNILILLNPIFNPHTIVKIEYIIKCISLSISNNLKLGKPKSGTGINDNNINNNV